MGQRAGEARDLDRVQLNRATGPCIERVGLATTRNTLDTNDFAGGAAGEGLCCRWPGCPINEKLCQRCHRIILDEKVVPLKGLEPPTPSLRMMCSTS